MHDAVLLEKITAALQHQRCPSSRPVQIVVQLGSEHGVLDQDLLVLSQVDQNAVRLVVSLQRTISLVELTGALGRIRIVSVDDRAQKIAQLVSFVTHHLGAVRCVDWTVLLLTAGRTADHTVARIGGLALWTRRVVVRRTVAGATQRLVWRVEGQVVQIAVAEQIHTDAGRLAVGRCKRFGQRRGDSISISPLKY